MDLIEVIDGGMLSTVQDRGRFGYQRYGVPTSGAMDVLALRAANRLVGNPDGAAAIEMTLLGPRVRFLAAATIALTGGDLGATLDGRSLATWESADIEAGAELWFEGPRDGVRGYLAVAGGIDVPVVLGSRSTYLRSRLGGYEGRALKAGDLLRSGGASIATRGWTGGTRATTGETPDKTAGTPVRRLEADKRRPVASGERPVYGHEHRVRVVLGPQDDRFTPEGIQTFLSSTYSVTPQSDRMGYRLAGPAIAHTAGPDIVSDGTPLGAVQVAGDGVPIVLMADRGTAGGYTKIATVIGPDVYRLSQAAPGDTVRFRRIELAEAHLVLREQEAWLDALRHVAAGTGGHRRGAAIAAAAVARMLAEQG